MALDSPTTLRTLQAIGLTSSLVLTTFNLTLSLSTVPILLRTTNTSELAKQWRLLYEGGKGFARPMALVTALSYLSLSYLERGGAEGWKSVDWKSARYILGAVLTLGIVPYTALIMGETNNELMARGEAAELTTEQMKRVESKSVHELVDWWGVLNLGRGAMLSVGSALGVWGVMF